MGFQDETWWSHSALPSSHAWRVSTGDPFASCSGWSEDESDPEAISCHGLYLPELEETWLRFVDGRPVSGITMRCRWWCSEKLLADGEKVLVSA